MGDKFEPLIRGEDWWAIWLGFLIIGLSFCGLIMLPKTNAWSTIVAIDPGIGFIFFAGLLMFLIFIALKAVKVKMDAKYPLGFIILYFLAYLCLMISKQTLISQWGLEYVIWALLVGLILGNLLPLPEWLRTALRSELFIKIGLVLLGAEILLQNLLAAGLAGLFEITIGLVGVWYFCYWLGQRMGMSKSFSSIMASATSICGVSAAIAAGGAVKGDQKEVSYTISLVLLFAIPMALLLPIAGRALGLSSPVMGAWIGGTIDTTPAVVASGALFSDRAMQVASIVKMSQNIMIGLAAFLLSLYWAVKIERKAGLEKPKLIEIWYRFPKFILGFIFSCVLFSLLPTIGIGTGSALNLVKGVRSWLFAMAFVSIGANTRFSELIRMGGGKPLMVFLAASALDVILSLVSAFLFFSKI